jgi:SAM-dependent methyltransferase
MAIVVRNYTEELGDLKTELCEIGARHGTDKSPHHTRSDLHRHGYTALYHKRFGHLRGRKVVVGEVGILTNASMRMWRDYIDPDAVLCGFELTQKLIDEARTQNLPRTEYFRVDVREPGSLRDGFADAVATFTHAPFTLLIDDSTHVPEHQVNVAREAMRFLAPGGWLVIEDVFREIDVDSRILHPIFRGDPWMAKNVGLVEVVTVNHARDHTPGWNNSKVILLQRKGAHSPPLAPPSPSPLVPLCLIDSAPQLDLTPAQFRARYGLPLPTGSSEISRREREQAAVAESVVAAEPMASGGVYVLAPAVKLVIITPCSRPSNLPLIRQLLLPHRSVIAAWIVVHDADAVPEGARATASLLTEFHLAQRVPGSAVGNGQRNRALQLVSEMAGERGAFRNGMLYFLDDDNVVHPDLFHFVAGLPCSGASAMYSFDCFDVYGGHGIFKTMPKRVNPGRECVVSKIDTAQVLVGVRYWIEAANRLQWQLRDYRADGFWIQAMAKAAPERVHYVSSILALNNMLDPRSREDAFAFGSASTTDAFGSGSAYSSASNTSLRQSSAR